MRGHAASRWAKWVGVYNELRPLAFSEYSSAKIENTVAKMRAVHLGRQVSKWDQDSRKVFNL